MLDLRPRRDFKAELDLTPFMDVIFILLLFFIIASAFAVRGLDIDLPPARSSQALSGRVVEIRLNEDGSFLCDGVPVERTFLRCKLQDIVRGFRKEPGSLCSRPPRKRLRKPLFLWWMKCACWAGKNSWWRPRAPATS